MYLWHPSCESPDPVDTLTDRLNTLLNSSGPGYTLSLCPSQKYFITAPLRFAAPDQEISTAGYPIDSTRATLVVAGPVVNGTGQTTAVDGKCANCNGAKLRNVQINGTRLGGPLIRGGANIEMGGPNADQLIEYVHSFDPRGWSCLHLAQGNKLNCTNTIVQHNEIGPAGYPGHRQWADGISVACRNSVIRNNMVNNPTDGGIVLFGSPGTRVNNNTIWAETQTLLGGINLVDISPFGGNYEGVVVSDNTIVGGFASQPAEGSEAKGTNNTAIIKIGIAIGPQTWFGTRLGKNVSTGGIVQDNRLTGAFSYGIAMNSATNFTVDNNVFFGNASFIGIKGPNCTRHNPFAPPAFFVLDGSTVQESTTQQDFESIKYNDSLVSCVMPPTNGDLWPIGENPKFKAPSIDCSPFGPFHWWDKKISAGTIIIVILFLVLITLFVWRWPRRRSRMATKVYPRYPLGNLWQKISVGPHYTRLPFDSDSNIS